MPIRRIGIPPVLLLAMILLMFVGCSGPEEEADEPVEEDLTDEENVVDYPVTMTDDAGREVEVSAEPERVASFDPSSTDILLYLEKEEHLVGVDDYSTLPEEMEGLPRLGGAVSQDVETLLALQPDLVLVGDGMDDLMAALSEEDIPAVVVDPESFSDISACVHLIAKIMAVPERGEEVVQQMEQKVQEISEMTEEMEAEERPVVFYEVWPNPLMTEGEDSLIDFLITSAGGINAAGDEAGDWIEFSAEDLVDSDPDVIITPFSDTISELDRGDRPDWEELSAVRSDRYYRVDSGVFGRRSPRLMQGLEEVARLLHPDLFE